MDQSFNEYRHLVAVVVVISVVVFFFLVVVVDFFSVSLFFLGGPVSARFDWEFFPDIELSGGSVSLQDETSLRKDAHFVHSSPCFAKSPNHDFLPPAHVDSDAPPVSKHLVRQQELHCAEGRFVVSVLARMDGFVGVDERLYVQRKGVEGRKFANGAEEGRRVRKNNVHVQLEDLQVPHVSRHQGDIVVVHGWASSIVFAKAGVVP